MVSRSLMVSMSEYSEPSGVVDMRSFRGGDSMYTDIREYFLPLQVLQEYVAAGEELGDELA